MYRHPFFTLAPFLFLVVLLLCLTPACVPLLPLSLRDEGNNELTNGSFSLLASKSAPEEDDSQLIDCDKAYGGFPPPLEDQKKYFFAQQLPPSLLVKHEGRNPNLQAILTFSWICQHKKHGRSPTPVQLFPEDRLVSFGGNDDRLNRIGHQITSLPDGRFVVSGGITNIPDSLTSRIDDLTAFHFFLERISNRVDEKTAYAANILLIDPHLSDDAGRIRPIGTTQRAYHRAEWTGNALYLQGGITPKGQDKDEIFRLPEAGKDIAPNSTKTSGDVTTTAFGQTIFLDKKPIDYTTGIDLSCEGTAENTCSFPESCLEPETVARGCENLEDRLILHTALAVSETSYFLVGGYLPIKNNGSVAYRANPYLMYVQIQKGNEKNSRQVYVTYLQDFIEKSSTNGETIAMLRPPLLNISPPSNVATPNSTPTSFLLLSNLQGNHHALLFQFEGQLSFRPKITRLTITPAGVPFDRLEFGLHALNRPNTPNEIFLLGSANSPRKLVLSPNQEPPSLQIVEEDTNDLFPAAFSAPAWMEQTRLVTGQIVFGGGLQIPKDSLSQKNNNSPLLIYTPPLSPPQTQENP